MRLSKAFRFKRKPVYALPTFAGLAMFALVGLALWFAMLHRAPVEQWAAFLMILLTVLHLLDANDPFRLLTVEVLPFDAPFAGEENFIPVLIGNPSAIPSEKLFVRFSEEGDWVTIPSIPAGGAAEVKLAFTPEKKGKQELPKIRIKMRPKSNLFQLWRVMESETLFAVLPRSQNHGVEFGQARDLGEHADASFLELIRDPRHLPKRDPKLFLKTGLPYLRKSDAGDLTEELDLNWIRLGDLPENEREEQFSYWIKKLESLKLEKGFRIGVETPFFKTLHLSSDLNLSLLKQNFSEWVSPGV